MKTTVFYAWQSDLPGSTNRNFVQESLERAIAFVNRTRNHDEKLLVDKDTQGEAGFPVIADAIFRKIDSCAVFVPDLSFVARTEKGKPVPNPNVLIELGHALGVSGGKRVVAVFNEAFGAPDQLPFDLRHRRWPIRYTLPPDASTEERSRVRERLTKNLVDAITTALNQLDEGETSESCGVELPLHAVAPKEESFFEKTGALSIVRTQAIDKEGRSSEDVFWHHGPSAWLRVVPSIPLGASKARLRELVQRALPPLRPFGDLPTTVLVPNYRGMVAIGSETNQLEAVATCISQVFQSGEIWGLNRALIEPKRTEPRSFVIPWPATEAVYRATLANYLNVARALGVQPPIAVVAGLAMVGDAVLIRPSARWQSGNPKPARCVEPTILWHGEIGSFDAPVDDLLQEFFQRVWDACHLDYSEWRSPLRGP